MLRSASILDIPSLVSLNRRALPDRAMTRDVLVTGLRQGTPYLSLVSQSVGKRQGNLAVVLSNRGRAFGFAMVRRCAGVACWEVERFEVAQDTDLSCAELFDAIGNAIAPLGAHRLLLRLREGSSLEDSARDAEFQPYAHEELFVLSARAREVSQPRIEGAARLPTPADELGIFLLFRSSAPAAAREAQGITLNQWKESRPALTGWRAQAHYVAEENGRIAGWAAVMSKSNCALMDIMASSEAAFEAVVEAALPAAERFGIVMCLLPSYQQNLATGLVSKGFAKRGDYVSYIRHVAAKIPMLEIAMARA